MKRGGPLQRRTPLSNRKGITGHRPQSAGNGRIDFEAAAAAIAHQRASAAAPERDRQPVPDPVRPAAKGPSGFPAVVRQTILDRDRYTCQRCGLAVDTGSVGYSLQHRIGRQSGGTSDPAINRPANGLTLCGSGTTGCHGWVEAHPIEAALNGWSVASWADPTTVPVFTPTGWVLLTDRGTRWPCKPPADGDAHVAAVRRTTTKETR